MKSFENQNRKQEAAEVIKLYDECLKVSREKDESGSNAAMFSYGDAAKRFVKELKKKFPEWHAKAVELADTASYTRSSRGSGQYRQNFYYLSFGDTGYYADPFPARLKHSELIQEAVLCLLRYITADRPKDNTAA